MPFVRIETSKGKSIEFKEAVMDAVQSALIDVIKISDARKIEQSFFELEPGNIRGKAAVSPKGVVIEVKIYSGRSQEIKKAFFDRLFENLKKNPGIEPPDLIVNIVEITAGDLSMG